jgi:hypothetical protein
MARARVWLGALAAGLALLAAACSKPAPSDTADTPLLPELAARQQQVDHIELRGAGDKPLVSLARHGDEWRLAQRAGWRADGARIAQYLAQLAQARRVAAKTDRAAMYPRIGVEDIADPAAGGTELRLSGKDVATRLIIGKPHKPSGGRFVRLAGQARSWQCDLDVGFEADPVSWLDHRLVSLPLARVERVRVRPRTTPAFSLVSRDDRFRPDDAPPGAMGDSHAGDDIASAVVALDIEDVADDDGPRQVSQSLDYELVDGGVLTLAVWREGQRDWMRADASFNEAVGAAWERQAGRQGVQARARAQVAEWSRRFAGRKFLLPVALARTLTLDHSEILEGKPAP